MIIRQYEPAAEFIFINLNTWQEVLKTGTNHAETIASRTRTALLWGKGLISAENVANQAPEVVTERGILI